MDMLIATSRSYDSTLGVLAVASLVVAASLGTTGCREATIPEKEARPYVESWSDAFESTFRERAEAPDPQTLFAERLQTRANEARESVERDGPPYALLADEAYRDIDREMRFVDGEGLTDRGKALWTRLDSVQDHAIHRGWFDLHRIEKLTHQIDNLETERHALSHVEPDETERRAAIDYLIRQPKGSFELSEASFDDMTETILAEPVGVRLERRLESLEEIRAEKARKMAALEHLLAVNALRYSKHMKHFRIKDVYLDPEAADYWALYNTDGRRPDRAKGPFVASMVRRTAFEVANDKKRPVAILHRRMRGMLTDLLTNDAPEQVLADLEPAHPQYDRLQRAYDRYHSIVASGGWDRVESEPMGPGYTKPAVADLKRRLRAEGYFPEDVEIDETYGEALTEAVEAYQETHQMRETGRPHSMFWSSLDVPAKRRMKVLGLNLQRWRGSNVRHEEDDLYVLVNIPGAHVEIWNDQQRDVRFRIVVGNGKIVWSQSDEDKIQKTANTTPVLSAYIDRVIYNPYWNLTDRIRNQEVIPKVRKSVVASYKAKLRRFKSKLQKPPEPSSSEDSTLDQLLVATDSSGGGTASTASTNVSGDGPETEPAVDDASPSTSTGGSASTGGVGLSAAGDSDDEASKEGTSDEEKAPDVDIGAYVRTDEHGNHVFDVSAIRQLVRKVRARDSSGNVESSSGSGGEGAKGDDASLLASTFPYIDPETGEVDVSSTDPDHIPAWYDENDYEVVSPGDQWEYVRMKQGPTNALGKVKVIFPNPYNVYLHDTPKDHLFSRDIRAFSHGCMRMQKPFSFAEYLLEQDGQYDDYNLEKILEGEKKPVKKNGEVVKMSDGGVKKEKQYEYQPIFLEEKIPVHVEYFTARVDDEGRAYFFSDVYDWDSQTFGDVGEEEG